MNEPEPTAFPNETLRTIAERRSIRQYTDTPLAKEQLDLLLQAANRAPSAHNEQSWRFLVLRGARKTELVRLVGERAASFPKPSSALLRMAARSISSAPVVIAVVNSGELIGRGTELFKVERELAHDFFRIMEIQSSAAAVQNLLLAATSLGLAAVWLGVLVLVKAELLRFLGEPQGEFMAVIPVGYPLRPGASPKKRELDLVVKYLD